MKPRPVAAHPDPDRCRLGVAASGLLCAAVAAVCTLPRHGSAHEAEAKPNVVLASALAGTPADDAAPGRPAEAMPSEREEASLPTTSRWSSGAELSGGQYRWSASRGSLDVGMNFAVPQNGQRFDFRSETSGPLLPALPTLSVGLRRDAQVPATASSLLERSTGSASNVSYVSKIGLEWKPPQSQVNFIREGLGIRLDGNNRMTVRLRKGVVGLYMQRKF